MKAHINQTMKSRVSHKIQKKNSLVLLGLCCPAMFHLLIFSYIPMIGIIIAFKKYNNRLGIFGSEWVGLDNFQFLFRSQDFVRIVRNTVLYNLMFIVVGTVFAVMIALLLDSLRNRSMVRLFQTSYFLPFFISWVVAAFIFDVLFDVDKGMINQLITTFGGKKLFWYQDTRPWPLILLIANVWKGFGYSTVIYYGAIMGIDQELFEAAKIDGCHGSQIVRYITLPLLTPTIIILTILNVGGIMRGDFGLFYYVTKDSGMLYSVTDIIDTYVFRALRKTGDISTSAAVGLFQSVIGFVLVMITNKIANIYDKNTALI